LIYSAFIEIPYTQGAQVGLRITQCYLQITPYLPLPRKHSPDGASQTEVADIQLQPTTHLSTPKGWKAELTSVAGYVMRQFTCPKAVTHPSTNDVEHLRWSRPTRYRYTKPPTTKPPTYIRMPWVWTKLQFIHVLTATCRKWLT